MNNLRLNPDRTVPKPFIRFAIEVSGRERERLPPMLYLDPVASKTLERCKLARDGDRALVHGRLRELASVGVRPRNRGRSLAAGTEAKEILRALVGE